MCLEFFKKMERAIKKILKKLHKNPELVIKRLGCLTGSVFNQIVREFILVSKEQRNLENKYYSNCNNIKETLGLSDEDLCNAIYELERLELVFFDSISDNTNEPEVFYLNTEEIVNCFEPFFKNQERNNWKDKIIKYSDEMDEKEEYSKTIQKLKNLVEKIYNKKLSSTSYIYCSDLISEFEQQYSVKFAKIPGIWEIVEYFIKLPSFKNKRLYDIIDFIINDYLPYQWENS